MSVCKDTDRAIYLRRIFRLLLGEEAVADRRQMRCSFRFYRHKKTADFPAVSNIQSYLFNSTLSDPNTITTPLLFHTISPSGASTFSNFWPYALYIASNCVP